jgi:hypothetical protein
MRLAESNFSTSRLDIIGPICRGRSWHLRATVSGSFGWFRLTPKKARRIATRLFQWADSAEGKKDGK